MKEKVLLSVLFLPFVAWGQAQEEPKMQTSQKTETQTDSVKTRQLDEVKVVAYKRIDKGSKGVQIFEPNFEALSEASPMIKALCCSSGGQLNDAELSRR